MGTRKWIHVSCVTSISAWMRSWRTNDQNKNIGSWNMHVFITMTVCVTPANVRMCFTQFAKVSGPSFKALHQSLELFLPE